MYRSMSCFFTPAKPDVVRNTFSVNLYSIAAFCLIIPNKISKTMHTSFISTPIILPTATISFLFPPGKLCSFNSKFHSRAQLTTKHFSALISNNSGNTMNTSIRRHTMKPGQHLIIRAASNSPGDDKTWGELLQDAVALGTSAMKKLGSTVTKAVSSISQSVNNNTNRSKSQQSPFITRQSQADDSQNISSLTGIFAKPLSSFISSTISSLIQPTQDTHEKAIRMISNNRTVLNYYGGQINCSPPYSTSSSSSTVIINGVRKQQKQVSISFSINSTGTAQVVDDGKSCRITVSLPNGDVFLIEEDNDDDDQFFPGSRSSNFRNFSDDPKNQVIDVKAK